VETLHPETAPAPAPEGAPQIFARAEHPISRKDIDEHALQLLYRLSSLGHAAYLVGGGVRDLYLGKAPKDFDIATDARPSKLKKIFRNSRIIGRRFRIAHVYFPDGKIIEVSTFRRGNQVVIPGRRGPILRDNEYGTPQEDALRRDITINGLFYDIATFSVIDYVGGVEDLRNRVIRTIADPDASFREDPVRMIRAERHAARTGFEIEDGTLQAIHRNRHLITQANSSRLLEEVFKDLRGGSALPSFRLMLETGLLDCLLPDLATQLREHGDHPFWERMRALDERTNGGAVYASPVLLSLLLHTLLISEARSWDGSQGSPSDVWRHISRNFKKSIKALRVSRRDSERVTQILITYPKLVQSAERQRLAPTLEKKPYLAEALDFLEVVLRSRSQPTELVDEWRAHAPPPSGPRPRYTFPAAGEGAAEDGLGEDGARGEGAGEDGTPGEGAPGERPEGTGEPRRRRRRRRRRRSR
jgi:poly(A) polymerase